MRIGRVVILGCGYTGERVARRLLARGAPVTATTRHPERLKDLALAGVVVRYLDVLREDSFAALADVGPGDAVLHSVPVVEDGARELDPTPLLFSRFGGPPARIVYLSTTGVYGSAVEVDQSTPAAPQGERLRLRMAAETAVLAGPWSAIVLRPAAIYGPGRGVHESLRQGRFRMVGDGRNYASRIHVDDLAALTEAALFSRLEGAWPVADREPCTSREITAFCAELLGLPRPPSIPAADAHHTRRANRRVNGSAVFEKLGVSLRYPSYRTGIPASLGT